MGEYTMKNKLLLILGISFCLVVMLAVETTLMGCVLYWAGIRTSSEPTDLSGLPYLLGALAVIALVFFLSRNDGARPEIPTQIIHLGYDRETGGDVVMHYAGKAEQRSFGKQTGGKIELVMPPNFERGLDYDAELNLKWLREHGPANGVEIK